MLIRTGFVQIKPWLLIAHARACFYFNVVVNKQIIQFFTCIFKIAFEWSGRGTVGFCPEPRRWVTEQNKDEAQCGCWKWSVYCEETHDRQVWLETFFSGKLNFLVSWKRDLIMQCLSQRFCSYFTYKFKWHVFFFLCDTFPCWQQKVKQILYFDKTNKNNKYAIFTFLYKLAYIIIICFSLRHLLRWQQNVKLIWFWTRRIK